MRRNLVRNLLFIVTACLMIGGSLIAMRIVMVHADTSQRVILNDQIAPLLQQAHTVRAADPNMQLNLSVGLQLQQQAALDTLLKALYDPHSPQYQHYLTPAQFEQQFAPTYSQVQQVVNYLHGQGLGVIDITSNNLLVNAVGTVAQVQQAFNTHINIYQVGGSIFYANATPPSVPSSISPLVVSVGGLNNSRQYHPLYQRLHSHTSIAGTTPTGLGPKELASAYDMQPLQNSGIQGNNQAIALFELDGYQQNDVNQYFQYYGLGNPNITNIPVDGFSGTVGNGAVEVELDIEMIAAIAPRATQLVYEGANTFQGINRTYNRIVTDNKAHVVSISWGLCEASSGNAELQTLDAIFKQGAAQGISFIAAAGDSGAYDCQDNNLAVDSPASDPYVTGVGGTNLQLSNGTYGKESVWSDTSQTQRGPKGAGSGGGISNVFNRPDWQNGSGVQNQYSNGNREVPDISAVGDPASGYSVYCTMTNAGCPNTGWMSLGGTSGAAPVWAASLLLVNQYLQAHNKGLIGHANPTLYKLFDEQQVYPPFHDVTNGNNLYYAAGTGYDLASGIGSPDVYNIARDLVVGPGTPQLSSTPVPTATPSPTPVPTQAAPQGLIKDNSFENGSNPWQESSSQGYEMVDSSNAHSGQYGIYFCGYVGCNDSIWQSFMVPNSYSKITVTYWWYSDTTKTGSQCLDTFNAHLQNSNGNTIRTLQQNCNTSVTNQWVQQSFDLSGDLASYTGKQVTLFFRGTTVQGQYQISDFFIDDVNILAS